MGAPKQEKSVASSWTFLSDFGETFFKQDAPSEEPLFKVDEDAALDMRRSKSTQSEVSTTTSALAFSGGGIRSATFCLGVLRALAKNKVLTRFDYLSTVSGGGYIGTAFGRLFRKRAAAGQNDADIVQERLACDNTTFLWWMRQNGRYLTPSGKSDIWEVAANYIRGLVSLHFELAVLALFFGCLIVIPHFVWILYSANASSVLLSISESLLLNPWWLLSLPFMVAAIVLVVAFWFSHDKPLKASSRLFHTAIFAVLLAAAIGVSAASHLSPWLWEALIYSLLFLLPCAVAAALLCAIRSTAFDVRKETQRVEYTMWLGGCLSVIFLFFLFGLIDLASWFVASNLFNSAGVASQTLLKYAAALLAALMAGRAAQPRLASAFKGAAFMSSLANALGLIALASVALLWVSVLQVLVFNPASDITDSDYLTFGMSLQRLAVIVCICALYMLWTAAREEGVNRSSLHEFYRSRLSRAYISVGGFNPGGEKPCRFAVDPLDEYQGKNADRVERINVPMDSDDARLEDYRPHEFGGPIHLINCCINQSVDDRTGTYNADRKGVSLTVSALGIEIGTGAPVEIPAPAAVPKSERSSLSQRLSELNECVLNAPLSRWVAISAAAVSTGMGSTTKTGVAALTFLSGLRTGYWLKGLHPRRLKTASIAVCSRLRKYCALWAEMRGKFPGLRGDLWYLTDGGHFDNTGVYALLKKQRQPDVIVLADCGADPDYLFTDFENLVRKARIDYQANIEIIDPASIQALLNDASMADHFGTPDSIRSQPGEKFLMLARVSYADGKIGALLVIKPRAHKHMPVDVAGYAARNPSFPQQTTADQFFDEAQWESYCTLGMLLAKTVNQELLEELPTLVGDKTAQPVFFQTSVLAQTAKRDATPIAETRRERFSKNAVKTFSIGALVSVALAAWQGWESYRDGQLEREKVFLNRVAQLSTDISTAGSNPCQKFEQVRTASAYANGIQDKAMVKRQLDTLYKEFVAVCEASGQLDADSSPEQMEALLRSDDERSRTWRALFTYQQRGTYAPIKSQDDRYSMPEGFGVLPLAFNMGAAPALLLTKPEYDVYGRAGDACSTDSKSVLYIQIYDEAFRPQANLVASEVRKGGVLVPEIENVTQTAKKRGQKPPYKWGQAALLYTPGDEACADAIEQLLKASQSVAELVPGLISKKLPNSLSGKLGALELWLPEQDVANLGKSK